MGMTKREELASGCIAKAADDEPVFVLRAQDRLSPILISLWAKLALELGCPGDKVKEALKVAEAMEAWPYRKLPD